MPRRPTTTLVTLLLTTTRLSLGQMFAADLPPRVSSTSPPASRCAAAAAITPELVKTA
jgi:hypothetical protein